VGKEVHGLKSSKLMINEEQEMKNAMNIYFIQNDAVSLSLKRRGFAIGGRLTDRLMGRSISGLGRFGKSVNRLTNRIPNRPHFGKKILFRLPNRILSVKSVGG
jgi:hypothetical protein